APVQILWAEDDPVISSANATIFQQISGRVDCYILPPTKRGNMAHSPEKIEPEVFLKLLKDMVTNIITARNQLNDVVND
ncbi:MAG: hypothetical protein ACFFD4_40690, partial [Candidatus Odinarchaeota archaeon]